MFLKQMDDFERKQNFGCTRKVFQYLRKYFNILRKY